MLYNNHISSNSRERGVRTWSIKRIRGFRCVHWLNHVRVIKRCYAAVSGPTDTLNYRLPTSVVPRYYDLRLQPEIYTDDPADFSFNGSVKIWIECVNATDVITLHAYRLNLEDMRESAMLLFENETDTGLVQEVTYDEPRHFLNVRLSQELGAGNKFVLYLRFSASMSADGVGLYYSSYQDGDQTV